jgi:type II secretion system protein N
VLRVGVPVAGVFLVLLFIFLGFPYDKLGERIADELERSGGVRIEFGGIGPGLQLAGPAIVATDVRATASQGESVRLQRALLRPAWSLAWLRGDRALFANLVGETGQVRGIVTLGERSAWRGTLDQVALGDLPLSQLAFIRSLDGVVDADIDLEQTEAGLEGQVHFEIVNGALDLEALPLPIPFDTLSGDLAFGDAAFVAIRELQLTGPLLTGRVSGNVLSAPHFAEAPLRLELQVEVHGVMQAVVRGAGIRIDRAGKGKVRITGTVDQPNVR